VAHVQVAYAQIVEQKVERLSEDKMAQVPLPPPNNDLDLDVDLVLCLIG